MAALSRNPNTCNFLTKVRSFFTTSYRSLFTPRAAQGALDRKILNRDINSSWSQADHKINVWDLIHDNLDIEEYLPTKSGDFFVVFLDHNLELDWATTHDIPDTQAKLIALAEAASVKDCSFLPEALLIEYRQQLGLVITCSLKGNLDTAKTLLKGAEIYLKRRTEETSRLWTAVTVISIVAVGGFITYLVSDNLLPTEMTEDKSAAAPVKNIAFPLFCGYIGAVVSLSLTSSKGKWDAGAGKRLHIVEVVLRLIVGSAFGAFIYALSRSPLSPTTMTDICSSVHGVAVMSFIAGFSERFIPKFISSYTSSNDLTKEND